jgi:hypothetical protein
MPESLLAALEDLGQQVDSVNHLKLKGLDNGTLYRQVARDYDLCFTRDAGFARASKRDSQSKMPGSIRTMEVGARPDGRLLNGPLWDKA